MHDSTFDKTAYREAKNLEMCCWDCDKFEVTHNGNWKCARNQDRFPAMCGRFSYLPGSDGPMRESFIAWARKQQK